MTSENYDTFDSPWHRRVLSRFRSAVAKYWNRLIYEPFQLLIRTLIRWLYGPNPPLFVHNWISAKGIAPASPLPLMRKRRLSITEFTLPGQSRTASKYNRLFSKLAKVQHLGSTTSTPPETYTLPPRFLERLVGRHDEFQCTAAQDQCPLLTKLPLELRLQIYGHVLGYRTLHIIHSHVPSLSLPPRFSLRTHPFHKRLDFEICKAPESHLNRNSVSEICTRASIRKSKFNGLGLIPALRYRGGTDQVADKVMVRVKYLLQKYERKGGPLALLKTCRIIYSEAIEIIYTKNMFYFFDPSTFLLFPTLLSPSRFLNLRHLTLHFTIPFSFGIRDTERYKFASAEWPRACAVLRTLPSLHTLTLSLIGPKTSLRNPHVYRENESPLELLSGVEVKGDFVVLLSWPVTNFEKSFETEFGMRILGKESVVEDGTRV